MPSVGRSKVLSNEHVTQVASAAGALDLRSLTVGVRYSIDGAGNLLIKRRPATTSIELVEGPIEFSIAPPADIYTFPIKIVVLSGEGPFRAFPFDYVSLLRR